MKLIIIVSLLFSSLTIAQAPEINETMKHNLKVLMEEKAKETKQAEMNYKNQIIIGQEAVDPKSCFQN